MSQSSWKENIRFVVSTLAVIVFIGFIIVVAMGIYGNLQNMYGDQINNFITPTVLLAILGYLLHIYRMKIDDVNDRVRVLEGKLEALEHLGEIKAFAETFRGKKKGEP